MRTTLDLDDRILAVAKELAAQTQVSLGSAVSELARRGLEARVRPADATGLPTFDVATDAAPITPDMVRDALDEG